MGPWVDTTHRTPHQHQILMPDTQPTQTSAEKAAADNRSQQLNPQDPTYHESRGAPPAEAAEAAAQATQDNQAK